MKLSRLHFFFVLLASFVALTLIYFRCTLFMPVNYLITRHQGTDTYIYMMNAQNFVNWLKHDFIPIGSYWVPHGGGFPATALDQFTAPTSLVMMLLYTLTRNLVVSVRIIMPLIYLCTLFASYWFATTTFKNRYVCFIFAVIYSFSVYGVTQLEHIDLLSAPIFVALTLGFLERLFATGRSKYIILTAVFAFITYLAHLYAFYFLGVFIVLRVLFEIFRVQSNQHLATVKQALSVAGLTFGFLLPYLLTQLGALPSAAAKIDLNKGLQVYARSAEQFFMRQVPNYFAADSWIMYLGIITVLLAFIPIITSLGKRNGKFIFYLLATIFFMMWAIGHYSPINVAQIIHNYAPMAYFIRVPGRAMIIGYFTLAVCACIGFEILLNHFKRPLLLTSATTVLICCDLMIGYSPTAMPIAVQNNNAYQYIAQQQGDFRVLEIPSISDQLAMSDVYTKHDVLGTDIWAYGYFEPLLAPSDLYEQYVNGTIDPYDTAFYGVKYVIVNTNSDYYATMKQPLKDMSITGFTNISQAITLNTELLSMSEYKQVYSQDGYTIYQDLAYKGMVFDMFPTQGEQLSYTYSALSPNTLSIDITTSEPTNLTISQCYDKDWSTSIGILSEADSMQNLSIPAGTYHIVLTYTTYKKSLLYFLVYIPLLAIIAIMLIRKKSKKEVS